MLPNLIPISVAGISLGNTCSSASTFTLNFSSCSANSFAFASFSLIFPDRYSSAVTQIFGSPYSGTLNISPFKFSTILSISIPHN